MTGNLEQAWLLPLAVERLNVGGLLAVVWGEGL